MSRNSEWSNRSCDVDEIKRRLSQQFPEIVIDQLKVPHPANDDGLWFFHLPAAPKDDIQIESSDGNCPFLIEDMRSNEGRMGNTIEEVVAIICQYFRKDIQSRSSSQIPQRKFTAADLKPGKTYGLVAEFIDYDGIPHPVGESWVFLSKNFLPYEDGLTLFVERDGKELPFRLQWRAETQAHIIDHFSDFVEEL